MSTSPVLSTPAEVDLGRMDGEEGVFGGGKVSSGAGECVEVGGAGFGGKNHSIVGHGIRWVTSDRRGRPAFPS